MLTEVKKEIKVLYLTIKYALMREMLNKASFIANIVFMVLNNSMFIIQWVILFSLKDGIGGYNLKDIFLLWGISASTYGFSHFFFKRSYSLSDTINQGKLDAYLVQPKNVLLSSITSDVEPSALGDILYGIIMLIIYGITPIRLLLFIFFTACGGFVLTAVAVIYGSLSFWFKKSDIVTDTANNLMTNFSTYPDGIFKGITKIILYTIIPVGLCTYMPIKLLMSFNIHLFLIVLTGTLLIISLAFILFNRGLKKYSSSNLMVARI